MTIAVGTKAVVAALLIVAVGPGTDEEVVQRERVRFAGGAIVGQSCDEVIAGIAEPGEAGIAFQYKLSGARRPGEHDYTGRVTFSLGEVVITMPSSIGWAHMSPGDRERAETLRHAIYHHEIGHVRIAEAVRDELNAHGDVTAPSPAAFQAAADRIGHDGFDRFRAEERAYDAFTDHGRKQHLAPGPLAGPDTVIVCR
jgi:predicted secreted Zn-dependent protease